jgi:hypothetical protein
VNNIKALKILLIACKVNILYSKQEIYSANIKQSIFQQLKLHLDIDFSLIQPVTDGPHKCQETQ